jgi:hypothetical protein
MFKLSKSINENAVKKDFFKKEKVISKKYVEFNSDINLESLLVISNFSEITLPKKQNQTFILTKLNRSFFDLLKNPDEVLVFCSRLNLKEFNKIKDFNLLGIALSERVLEKNEDLYKLVKSKTKVKFKNNHCKILLFKEKDNFYVVEGSGNPSINARNEFYIIHNNEVLYSQIKKTFEDA